VEIPEIPTTEAFYVTLTLSGTPTDADVERIRLASGASDAIRFPPAVISSYALARSLGFRKSSAPETGRFLAALAAGVRYQGRVLELGTGAGVGLAWLVYGLDARDDVEVVSVEKDSELVRRVRAAVWPEWVHIVQGGAAEAVLSLGSFDLIFADTPIAGSLSIDKIVSILKPGGVLIFDDSHADEPAARSRISVLRHGLLQDSCLVCADLAFSTGIMFVTRKYLPI
jgi:predicted O-methyltransferase YrrM